MADIKEAEHVSTSESEQSDLIEPDTPVPNEDCMLVTSENFINIDYEALENYDSQPSGVIHEIVRSGSQDHSEENVLSSSNDEVSEVSASEDTEQKKEVKIYTAFVHSPHTPQVQLYVRSW